MAENSKVSFVQCVFAVLIMDSSISNSSGYHYDEREKENERAIEQVGDTITKNEMRKREREREGKHFMPTE